MINFDNIEEILLPDGSGISEVIGPDGTTLWSKAAALVPFTGASASYAGSALVAAGGSFADNQFTANFDITGLNTYTYDSNEGADGSGAYGGAVGTGVFTGGEPLGTYNKSNLGAYTPALGTRTTDFTQHATYGTFTQNYANRSEATIRTCVGTSATTTNPIDRTVRVLGTVPAGYSNTGDTIFFDVVISQPGSAGTQSGCAIGDQIAGTPSVTSYGPFAATPSLTNGGIIPRPITVTPNNADLTNQLESVHGDQNSDGDTLDTYTQRRTRYTTSPNIGEHTTNDGVTITNNVTPTVTFSYSLPSTLTYVSGSSNGATASGAPGANWSFSVTVRPASGQQWDSNSGTENRTFTDSGSFANQATDDASVTFDAHSASTTPLSANYIPTGTTANANTFASIGFSVSASGGDTTQPLEYAWTIPNAGSTGAEFGAGSNTSSNTVAVVAELAGTYTVRVVTTRGSESITRTWTVTVSGGFPSKAEYKKNSVLIGESPSGIPIWEFEYTDEVAELSGLYERYQGVMVEDVLEHTFIHENGLTYIDYTNIDVNFTQVN